MLNSADFDDVHDKDSSEMEKSRSGEDRNS